MLVEEILSAQSRMRHDTHKEAITSVLAAFGLSRRTNTENESSRYIDHEFSPPSSVTSSSSTTTLVTTPPRSRATSYPKTYSRRTFPAAAHWWSHQRANSSTSKLYMPSFNDQRRPSLPVISSPTLITSTYSGPSIPQMTMAMNTQNPSIASRLRQSAITTRLRLSSHDSLTAFLTFSDADTMRSALLHHLLATRYRLRGGGSDDWFLGAGKLLAGELVSGFHDIRTVLHLSLMPSRVSLYSASSEAPEMSPERSPSISPLRSLSSGSIRQRDVSFDLEQYIADISHGASEDLDEDDTIRCARRESASADSIFTMTTTGSVEETTRRASLLSSFTIREATREWHAESTARTLQFPRRASLRTFDVEEQDARFERLDPLPSRGRQTDFPEAELLDSPFSVTPPKASQRHFQEHTSARMRPLPASDFGAEDQSPGSPRTPPIRYRSDWDNKYHTSAERKAESLESPKSPTFSDLSTPRACFSDEERSRRRAFRNFAIFDGEQFSPSPTRAVAKTPTTPLVPSRTSSLKQLPPLPTPEHTPLKLVLSLFDGDIFSSRPRKGLTTKETERIFSTLVESEVERVESQGLAWDGQARGHVVWLIEQVRDLVCLHLD